MALIPSKSHRPPYGVPNCSPYDSLWFRGGTVIGWTPTTNTHPTAFSVTHRGGYAGANFGIWADGGMRVVRHDATTAWLSIRTISGISAGSSVSCWATVTGTSNAIGIGLGNASVLLSNYAGADANGVTLFGDAADVYSGGASVESTTGTLAQNDRVRMDVNRVANTVRFYKQTGGTGSYVAMCDAVDISGLGSGVIYPVCSAEDANCVVTWDFGHGSESAPSGFIAGPVGPWGGWLLPHDEIYFGADTTRMWELSTEAGTAAPNVVSTDPVGAWHGVNYARLLSTATSSNRPEKTATGVKFDSSGGLKQINHALAVALTQPQAFTVMLRVDDVSLAAMRAGFGTSSTTLSGGQPTANVVQRGLVRSTSTTTTASFAGAVRTIVVTYDGASTANILDADGNWITAAVGTNTANLTHIFLRFAVTAGEAGISTVRVFQVATTGITETEARNWKYWAENNLEAATA